MVKDSPCNGVCLMEGVKCKSCHRTFDDLEQWLYMSKEAREYRMEQIKRMLEASGDCV